MLAGGPPYVELKYGLNSSWYVIYDNEETTQKAYLHIQNLDYTFNNKPVCVCFPFLEEDNRDISGQDKGWRPTDGGTAPDRETPNHGGW